MVKCLNEFEFRPYATINYDVTEKLMYNLVATLNSVFIFDWIFLIHAGNKDLHKSLDEFEFQQDLTTDNGVRYP